MINARRIFRLKNNEHFPVLILAISVIIVIHLCNKHDEKAANQYMMEDYEKNNPSLCPLYPSTLKKNRHIDMSIGMEWADIEQRVQYVQTGGIYFPKDCTTRQHLAIIIPFRNRDYQLKLLLYHLHPFLQRQKRSYQIFVVEQYGNGTFNKGLIMNVAFNHASKATQPSFDCFMFHDVDLIPENDYNVYVCDPQGPRHLAPAVDELRYFLMYNDLIGGVLALTKIQFMKANGWSNLYWGWGFEDDDMNHRLRHAGYRISRPPNHIGRYKMIRHTKQVPASNRYETLSKWLRYSYDGIRQLNKLDYSVVSVTTYPLYTRILVNFTRLATKTIDHLLEDSPKMWRKRFDISLIILHLIFQLAITFISALQWFLLVIALIVYSIVLWKQFYHSNNPSLFSNHYLSTIIFAIIHYIFTLSYNKILPWEKGLTVLFLILCLHYARRLGASIFRPDLTWLPFGYRHEYDPSNSIVVVKFLVSNLLLFGYSCQLCLTTVCTPSIYLDWFLIVNDCRYTYTYLLSSYTFAGGVLILLSWTIVSLIHLIVHRIRSQI